MKLTNYIRDAFVRAAMQDVPAIDYEELIRKEVTRASLDALPASVRAVYADEATRPILNTIYRKFGSVSAQLPGWGGGWHGDIKPALKDTDVKTLNAIVEKEDAQNKLRNDLERKLKGAAYAATTRKALAEMLPEFEKYLPADEPAAIRTLPVVANIVADFTKAGWPKTKKQTARSAA